MAYISISNEVLANIKDKVVLITGGSSGIGKATAQLCLNLGAHVVISDLNPPQSAFTDAERLKFVQTDVTDWVSLRSMFIQAEQWFSRIDHVFANAGVSPTTNLLDVTLDADGLLEAPGLRTVNVNLIGVMYTVKLAAAYMTKFAHERPAGSGSIVLTGSCSSLENFSAGDYTITKHGVLGILRGVGNLMPGNVRLNAVAPSWTATPLAPVEFIQSMGAAVQSPDVVARSVVLLFTDEKRHQEVIYSWDGRCKEVNKAEGGLLAVTEGLLDNSKDEERVVLKLREVAASSKAST